MKYICETTKYFKELALYPSNYLFQYVVSYMGILFWFSIYVNMNNETKILGIKKCAVSTMLCCHGN